jgi:SPP1 gp7 family putative phage head morphogenesis protein
MDPVLIEALRTRARKRKKRTKSRIRPARFQRGVDYERDLVRISKEISDKIRAEIFPLLDSELTEDNGIRYDAPVPTRIFRTIEGIRIELAETTEPQARRAAVKGMTRAEQANRAAMNQQFKKVIGIDPFKESPRVRDALLARIRENVDLIRTIPDRQLSQVEKVVREGIQAGTRVENIKELIEERFKVSEARARLIARDQVGKLNGQLAEVRQRDLGITRYTWASSQDERVREMHRELNGTVHSWNDPPVTNEQGDRNHPGEDYQCRCSALPDVEGVLDRLGI